MNIITASDAIDVAAAAEKLGLSVESLKRGIDHGTAPVSAYKRKAGGGIVKLTADGAWNTDPAAWLLSGPDIQAYLDELAAPLREECTTYLYYEGMVDGPYQYLVDGSYPVYRQNGEPGFHRFTTPHHVHEYLQGGGSLAGPHITSEQAARLKGLN